MPRRATRTGVPIGALLFWLFATCAAWADLPQIPLKRLPGPQRAAVLAALGGLIILGFAMVLLTWLGARVTRRYMQGSPRFKTATRPQQSDWSPQPLQPGEKPDALDEDEPDEDEPPPRGDPPPK